MNHKVRTNWLKDVWKAWILPLAAAVILVVFLRITGLMGYVTYAGQWAILKTGLADADGTTDDDRKDFDFNFTIKDLSGNRLDFAQFKGKVIFLNLWATWCGPCRAEMPGIHELYKDLDPEKVTVVMLSVDKDSDQPKVIRYLEKNGYTFHTYLPSGYLPEELRVPSIPTTFIIAKDGTLVKKFVGTREYDTDKFKKFLQELSEE